MADTIRVADLNSLLQGYQHADPRLYDILSGLIGSVEDLQDTVFPIVEQISNITEEPIPDVPLNFAYSTTLRNLILTWSAAANARTYEIRRGSDWDTASQVTVTGITEVRLDPIAVGTTRYLLKALNGNGEYSTGFATLDVIILPIGSTTITGRVIDNFVLLTWSIPGSTWDIDFYTIKRGTDTIGIQRGTFIAIFEAISGTFTYSITPTDIAGNLGPTASITLVVSQPADFELLDFRVSLLDQSKTNALIYGDPILGWINNEPTPGWDANLIAGQNWTWEAGNTGKILVCIDLTQTYQVHFTSRAWNTPQDQVSAGYPIYIQPTLLTAQYQEVIDYGTVLTNNILSIDYTLDQLTTAGTVTATPGIEFSLDGISWTAIVHAKSAFSSSFRYARVTIDFTASNDKALAMFYNLSETLDVKREIDSGNINALASDATGTVVTFNKAFKDVDSITVTATKSIEPLTIIYDFVDIPNPTFFKVLVFNSTGVRVDALVSWKARGIV